MRGDPCRPCPSRSAAKALCAVPGERHLNGRRANGTFSVVGPLINNGGWLFVGVPVVLRSLHRGMSGVGLLRNSSRDGRTVPGDRRSSTPPAYPRQQCSPRQGRGRAVPPPTAPPPQ